MSLLRSSGFRVAISHAIAMVLLSAATFVFIEGLSSTVLFLRRTLQEGQASLRYFYQAEQRRHVQFDETLGWVGMPDRYIADLYGQGKYLKTDSRGFRSDREIESSVTPGRFRVICSGDSFTFGQGVANDKTWCHLLSTLDQRIESVNMGQRGYGVDQAYLWYKEAGAHLDHDLHLFAFIGGDFERMRTANRDGYGKPILTVEDGRLVAENTPVPRLRLRQSWMSRLGRAAQSLSSVKLGRRLHRKWLNKVESREGVGLRSVAKGVFEDLDRVMKDQGGVLVLVWLPVLGDITDEDHHWRHWVTEFASRSEIPFVDLSVPIRELPPEVARSFFIGRDDTEDIDSAGHYNDRGHHWVATELYGRVQSLIELGHRRPESRASSVDRP